MYFKVTDYLMDLGSIICIPKTEVCFSPVAVVSNVIQTSSRKPNSKGNAERFTVKVETFPKNGSPDDICGGEMRPEKRLRVQGSCPSVGSVYKVDGVLSMVSNLRVLKVRRSRHKTHH